LIEDMLGFRRLGRS